VLVTDRCWDGCDAGDVAGAGDMDRWWELPFRSQVDVADVK
jgi:hypothetical protein